jgi:16S rRNA G1207 methylase RsmC
MIIVANRHLPYEKSLAQTFRRVSELAANDHFKVISAQR